MNNINKNRMKKELEMFSTAPVPGISCAASNDRLDLLSAQIIGAPGTPYEGGIFQVEIHIPSRYPFEPPRIRFETPIYHPNIDTSGRICLDTLKLPPKGTWRPCLNISTVLMMIRVLMAEPGSEDPLMTDIWQEFNYSYTTYVEKAKEWTKLHASGNDFCKENKAQNQVRDSCQDTKLNNDVKTNKTVSPTTDPDHSGSNQGSCLKELVNGDTPTNPSSGVNKVNYMPNKDMGIKKLAGEKRSTKGVTDCTNKKFKIHRR